MTIRRISAALFLLSTGLAAAQNSAPAVAPTPPKPTPPAAMTPAPMPDPLMSPDLQRLTPTAPTLAALVAQSAMQDAVVAAARQQFKQISEACGAAQFKPTGTLKVYNPAQFDAQGTLVAGVWSERVDVTGCKQERQINVLTLLRPGEPPQRFATLPGDSHADPATQKNALEYAQAVAIRSAPKGCKHEVFTNTKFDGYVGLPNPEARQGESRSWVEDWYLDACGTTYVIQMTFHPNASGLQLSATNPVKQG